MRSLEAQVMLMGYFSIVIDCNQSGYRKLEKYVAKYCQFTSMGVGSVECNPLEYRDVEINIAPNEDTDPKKYLECLRDLTKIMFHD